MDKEYCGLCGKAWQIPYLYDGDEVSNHRLCHECAAEIVKALSTLLGLEEGISFDEYGACIDYSDINKILLAGKRDLSLRALEFRGWITDKVMRTLPAVQELMKLSIRRKNEGK